MALFTHLPIYSGCGNTFVIAESVTDGLLYLVPSQKADFGMRIFNKDGSEASMCGNGLRCLVAYLRDTHQITDSCTIETPAGIHHCKVGKEISVSLPLPKILGYVSLNGYDFTWVDASVPHAVAFVDAFPENFVQMARTIRNHPHFAPEGVNVDFVLNDRIRTYERGVEGETKACGTGAVAVSFAVNQSGKWQFASGEYATIHLEKECVWLTADVKKAHP